MFLDEFPTLTETFILNQIAGILDHGHDLQLIARFQSSYDQEHEIVQRYNLKDRVRYLGSGVDGSLKRGFIALASIFLNRSWWSSRGLRALFDIYRGRSRTPQIPLLDLVTIASLGLEQDFDVIHCQYATLGRRLEPVIEMGLIKGNLVVSVRGHDVTDEARVGDGYVNLFDNAKILMPVSKSLKNLLVHHGCAESKIQVLHSGIDCHQFVPVDEDPDHEVFRIISVGRHVPMKGLSYAIDAIHQVISSGYQVEYHIVGDGPLRCELEQKAAALGIGESLRFHGWLTHHELKNLLGRCDIVLQASVTLDSGEAEGIPNAVKEAMASGLAAIGTKHAGIPELVIHGQTGLLVPERDAKAMSDSVIYMIQNPEKRRTMGEHARKFVLDHFDSSSVNEKLIKYYERACAN